MRRLLLAGLLCLPLNAQTRIIEYTNTQTGPDTIALGFPVPRPVDTPDRFDGFRSYAGLQQKLGELAFTTPELGTLPLGNSLDERAIRGFVFGQQNASPDIAGMLQTGTVHAREWASPEVLTHIVERLVEGLDHDGLERYLADHASILLVPVINPDGFFATQQAATSTRVEEDPAGDADTPRDGRMRRKNLRDTDGDLNTAGDSLEGVDLNRNIGRFWARSGRSSADPESIVYHGSSEASEPETLALKQAAAWFAADQLRLYIDTHSFGRIFFFNDTGNSRLSALTRELVGKLRRVPARDYTSAAEISQTGIGANDEYFAYEFQVPSYTLELEPGTDQSAEYGGNPGVSHSGFILPENQIARVREEAYAMALLAYYHQAGPPHLAEVSLRHGETGALAYRRRWEDRDGRRVAVNEQQETLQTDVTYTLNLLFDKPMRLLDSQQQPRGYAGQAQPQEPVLRLYAEGAERVLPESGRWQTRHYTADTYVTTLQFDAALGTHARLGVQVRDLAGLALDTDPTSPVSWRAGHWQDYEDTDGRSGDTGGEDKHTCFSLDSTIGTACARRQGGGSGALSLWVLILGLHLRRSRNR